MSKQASPIFVNGISFVTATQQYELGEERIESGEKYVYVYNCGGHTAAVRLGMSRPASAAAGLYSASVSSVSGDMPLGFVKHVAIPSGEYGWILKKGRVEVAVASSASDQAAGAKALGAAGLVATLGAGYFAIGELTTAIVSGNSGVLYVNVP
jgi:hypothetical protein